MFQVLPVPADASISCTPDSGQASTSSGASAAAMVGHIRATIPVVRLAAPVFAWNPASMRVLEKVGFEREGVLRQSVFKDGEQIDAVLYSLILEELLNPRP